jgi:hypothetical protein
MVVQAGMEAGGTVAFGPLYALLNTACRSFTIANGEVMSVHLDEDDE